MTDYLLLDSWDIEVFFKISKSYLQLATEVQRRNRRAGCGGADGVYGADFGAISTADATSGLYILKDQRDSNVLHRISGYES